MISTSSALDTLMKKVSSAAGKLSLMQGEVLEHRLLCPGPDLAHVWTQIRDLRIELSSAWREARNATTTEPRIFGETKLINTLNVIPGVTVDLAQVNVLIMKTIALLLQEIGKASKTSDGGNNGCEK